jgi:hypothetical protein
MAEVTEEAASVTAEKEEEERKQVNAAKRQKRRQVKSEVISPDLAFAENRFTVENQK